LLMLRLRGIILEGKRLSIRKLSLLLH
jgi:hypothetical protein